MVKEGVLKYLYIVLLVVGNALFAQKHVFSEVSINKTSAFVGEPIEVTVAVYTSTWFTKGVNPGNIKVNNAFSVYFRSLSTSQKIDGQTYAGVQLIFNVFPYTDKDIEFPSLTIDVETPDLGGYKGVKRRVVTRSRNIKVKSIPSNIPRENWLVSSNVYVSESWSKQLSDIKVGDVVKRTITRTALNTVQELVPSVVWDSIPNVSLYPITSSSKNKKTKTSISASRTEGVQYLFEKEGEIILPSIEVIWWNPYRKKLYKKTLKSVTVNVQENPNLEMLRSVRDSLNMEIKSLHQENTSGKNKKQLIKKGLLYGGLGILVLIILVISFIKGKKYFKKRKENYLNSEAFYFDKFKGAAKENKQSEALNYLYKWIDRLELEEPTLNYLCDQYFENEELKKEIELLLSNELVKSIHIQNWKKLRTAYFLVHKKKKEQVLIKWINP